MASVSSLDHDMRQLRLERYTPQAAQEVRVWIEETLGERLPEGDVLEQLKDGVALCKLANLILPAPGIRYKASSMPFTQRENIAQFLRACEMPPLNLPAHDRFLTVDLYDTKDPAQVIQCIGAFSRAANAANPSRVPRVIGPKKGPAASSPTRKFAALAGSPLRQASPGAGPISPPRLGQTDSTRSTDLNRQSTISSWSNKSDESSTAPAWNIHQYGYMGGASQGNQGISFGARRQITAQTPNVPSLAEKEKQRRQREEEEARLRKQEEELERARRQAEDEAQKAEAVRWQEETRKAREAERAEVERQKRKWEDEERRWREEEEARKREEEQAARASTKPKVELRGQYLSEYNAKMRPAAANALPSEQQASIDRVRELEKQLEEARERERQYQLEREQRAGSLQPAKIDTLKKGGDMAPPDHSSSQAAADLDQPAQDDSLVSEQEYLPPQQSIEHEEPKAARPLPAPRGPSPSPASNLSARNSLPEPAQAEQISVRKITGDEQIAVRNIADEEQITVRKIADDPPARENVPIEQPANDRLPSDPIVAQPAPRMSFSPRPSPFAKPGPAPAPFTPPTSKPTPATNSGPRPLPESPYAASRSPFVPRTERFLAANPAPASPDSQVQSHASAEFAGSSSGERAAEDARRQARQQNTKAGGWAGKSLLEREMERERERQREWEEQELAKARAQGSNERKVMGPRGMGAR